MAIQCTADNANRPTKNTKNTIIQTLWLIITEEVFIENVVFEND